MSRVLPILFNTDMVQAILDGRKTVTRRIMKPQPWKIGEGEHECKHEKGFYDMGGNEWACRQCGCGVIPMKGGSYFHAPYQPSDILYVRETWSEWTDGYVYRAWTEPFPQAGCYPTTTWHPSIHMPKEATRIWLKVTDVRVERLQDIHEKQAIREGIIRLYDDLSDAEYIDWARKTGIYPKEKGDWGYKNYLWHGNLGKYGTGNKMSNAWEYQYSAYDNAIDSFSSLWNKTVPLKNWDIYGWKANPWVWVIEFERCEKPESETDISKRIEECSLQKEYGAAGRDGNGACLGFGKPFDDEPIEQCKQCIAYTGWEREAESYEQ